MKYSNIELMESAPVLTSLVRFAVPTVLGIIVQLVYNITDTYFIGLLDDYRQIVGVSLAMPIMLVANALSHIFSAGAPSYISRLLGRKEYDEVKKTSDFAFYTTVFMGIVVAVVILFFLKPIVRLIGANDETFAFTYDYSFIILAFSVISMSGGTLQGLLRSEGAAKLASIGMIIGAVVNMLLDPLFILVFKMGVKGAAIATVLGNASSFAFFLVLLCRKKNHVSIASGYYRPNLRMVKEALSIGIPSSLSMVIMSLAVVVSNTIASSYGTYVIAASGIITKALMAAVMIIMGISMGMQPFIGFNYGAKNYGWLFSGIRSSVALGTCVCLLFAILFAAGASWFVRQFSSDVQVIAIDLRMMRLAIIGLPFMSLQMTFMTYLQSTGQALKAMIVNLSRQCLILIPVITLMNLFLKLDGFLLAQPIADIATTTLAIIMVLPGMLELSRRREASINSPKSD
ncbi:MAG: MATE family efflux transporter [Treponema sp.]|nr:MATE family efflux transporter [Treponema sp.]